MLRRFVWEVVGLPMSPAETQRPRGRSSLAQRSAPFITSPFRYLTGPACRPLRRRLVPRGDLLFTIESRQVRYGHGRLVGGSIVAVSQRRSDSCTVDGAMSPFAAKQERPDDTLVRYLIAFVVFCHGFIYVRIGSALPGPIKEWNGSSWLLGSALTHDRLKARCLRRSLLIRQPFVVRAATRASATWPRPCRRPPRTRAE